MMAARNQFELTTNSILGKVPYKTPKNVDKELERLKLQINAEMIQNKSKMGDSKLSQFSLNDTYEHVE